MKKSQAEDILSALIDIRVALEENRDEIANITETLESDVGVRVTINENE
tara:strand:+ start:4137 stop:4283 length:147 start_codon:yes stop_codon:yes gene_type:complete